MSLNGNENVSAVVAENVTLDSVGKPEKTAADKAKEVDDKKEAKPTVIDVIALDGDESKAEVVAKKDAVDGKAEEVVAAKENAKPNGDVVVSEKAEEKEKEAKDEKKEVTPDEKKNGDTKTTPKKVDVEVEITATGEVQKSPLKRKSDGANLDEGPPAKIVVVEKEKEANGEVDAKGKAAAVGE
jgi:hypothetical protein